MRGDELPLLDVHDPAGASGGEQQVGLPAEEGGDLEDVGDLGRGLGLRGLVDIGQTGKPSARDAGEDAESFAQAGTAVALDAACGWLCRTMP